MHSTPKTKRENYSCANVHVTGDVRNEIQNLTVLDHKKVNVTEQQ
jgi:hypothetical protein